MLPLSKEAATAIAHQEADESTAVLHLEIASQSGFESLWEEGLFRSISKKTGIALDDYEENVIPADKVFDLEKVARELLKSDSCCHYSSHFYSELIKLCAQAKTIVQPIFFVL